MTPSISKGSCVATHTPHHRLLAAVLDGLYYDRIFPSSGTLKIRVQQMKVGRGASPDFEELVESARLAPDLFDVEECGTLAQSCLVLDPVEFEQSSWSEVQGTSLDQCIYAHRTRRRNRGRDLQDEGDASERKRAESVTFVIPPPWFLGWVDAADENDPYPEGLWVEFERYLENLARLVRTRRVTGPEDAWLHAFKGGRYGMAVELQQRRLPFLEDRRLGELCHIVQLALRRRLLAYESHLLVPTAAHAASQNARIGLPSAPNRPPAHVNAWKVPFVQTVAELRQILEELLQSSDGLYLAMLKVKILETKGVRLSETVFGCTKLIELVRLPEIAEICWLEHDVQRGTYRLLPRSEGEFDDAGSDGSGQDSQAQPLIVQHPSSAQQLELEDAPTELEAHHQEAKQKQKQKLEERHMSSDALRVVSMPAPQRRDQHSLQAMSESAGNLADRLGGVLGLGDPLQMPTLLGLGRPAHKGHLRHVFEIVGPPPGLEGKTLDAPQWSFN